MAIFKLTTKKLLVSNGITFPWGNSTVKSELQRQMKMKYNVDFPIGFINANNLNVE